MLACLLLVSVAAPSAALACDDDERCEEEMSRRARASRRHAWGTFFAQTGFALATSAALPALDAVGWDPSRDEVAVTILIPVLTGGGAALGYLAEEERWDAGLGWALAGTWPGAILGASAGVAGALLAEPGDRDALLTGLGVGAAAGALTGALAWYLEHAGGGRPGVLTTGFYGGYFTGLLAGLGALAMGDGVEAQVAPLLASATGALFGVLVAELFSSAGAY